MSSIRKNGKKWLAEVRTKGIYKSKTFATKQEAQGWALKLEQQIGKNPSMNMGRTLREAMQRYAKEVSPTRKGGRWEIIRLNKIERDKIADIGLTDLKREDMQAWIGRQTTLPSSINRDLHLISAVLKEARVQWNWMAENPLLDLKRPKDPPPRDRVLLQEEIARILLALEYEAAGEIRTIRQQIAAAFLIAIETAMRQGEIWGLEWERIFLDKKYVTLSETKNGTRRNVALSAAAIELFQKLNPQPAGKVFKVSQASAGVIFRRAVQLAGITNLTFHDTRHTAITNLARKLDVLDLARMVGHKDLRSLMIYYNASAEEIAGRL